MMRARVAYEFDAVALLERDVDNDDIGIEFLDGDARVARGFRLPAHREIVFEFDEAAQPLAHDRVIIDEQHATDLLLLGHAARVRLADLVCALCDCHDDLPSPGPGLMLHIFNVAGHPAGRMPNRVPAAGGTGHAPAWRLRAVVRP